MSAVRRHGLPGPGGGLRLRRTVLLTVLLLCLAVVVPVGARRGWTPGAVLGLDGGAPTTSGVHVPRRTAQPATPRTRPPTTRPTQPGRSAGPAVRPPGSSSGPSRDDAADGDDARDPDDPDGPDGPDGSGLVEVENRLADLAQQIVRWEATARQLESWSACTGLLPVDELGDRDASYGFAHDDVDGTGSSRTTALTLHDGSPATADYAFITFSRDPACRRLSTPQGPDVPYDQPPSTPVAAGPETPAQRRARQLAVLGELQGRAERLEQAAATFDGWESCLSWVPVTESGDPDGAFGYVQGGGAGPPSPAYRPAVSVDLSPWDDPDYELLAFVGTDRPGPGVECGSEPGEQVDLVAAARTTRAATSLAEGLDDLQGRVEDLREPLSEYVTFNGCMFLLGVSSSGGAAGGYDYSDEHAAGGLRGALAFAAGPQTADHDVMAFPGEEPPQIECDEDAGDQDTEE